MVGAQSRTRVRAEPDRTVRRRHELVRLGLAGSLVLGCASEVPASGADVTGDGSSTTTQQPSSTASSLTTASTAGTSSDSSSGADETTTGAATPILWSAVAVGFEHGCGIDEIGRLFCWGSNADGQLGLADAGLRGPTEVTT